MSDFKKKGVYFLPLGGADEIGMNMYMYAVDGKIIVVDAGYGFLLDDYPSLLYHLHLWNTISLKKE